MPNITIEHENGELFEVSTKTMFQMLKDEHSYIEVLGQLMRYGRLEVELKTGRATLHRKGPDTPPIRWPMSRC